MRKMPAIKGRCLTHLLFARLTAIFKKKSNRADVLWMVCSVKYFEKVSTP